MTNIDISQENINTIFSRFEDELHQLDNIWNTHQGNAETGYFEGQLAYALIREYKPKTIFAIGPNCGFDLYPLALAMQNNGNLFENESGQVYTFEKDKEILNILTKNLRNAKIEDVTKVIYGDFRFTSLDILKEMSRKEEKIDLLWIDNGHEYYTAEWYIANLFPHVKSLVFVHDMTYGTPNPFDEKHIIFDFLNKYPYPNILLKDCYKNTTTKIKKRDGPGGSANSGIWIDMTPKGW